MLGEQRIYIDNVCYLTAIDSKKLVSLNGRPDVKLTDQEYDLLSFLLRYENRTVTTSEMGKAIWGYSYDLGDYSANSLDKVISRLRTKLNEVEPGFAASHLIRPQRGHYQFRNYSRQVPGSGDAGLLCCYDGEADRPCSFFILPPEYLPPQQTLDQLLRHAFEDSPIHAICGPRGQGKTQLSRYYAAQAVMGPHSREEIRYRRVVSTVYRPGGLRATVATLPCCQETKDTLSFSNKLELLRQLPKPSLLIIDNYCNEESCEQEFSMNNPDFQALVKSGVHILLTTAQSLHACDCIRQTLLKPLSPSQQRSLFQSLSGLEKSDPELREDLLTPLLHDCLQENTYLICLAAKLVGQSITVEELLHSFQSLQVKKLRDRISHKKPGEETIRRSLMNHFRHMMDLAALEKNANVMKVLQALALLPLGGIPYHEFIEMAFPENDDAQQIIGDLMDRFWCFSEHRYLRLHPMIRELILDAMQPEAVHSFVIHIIARNYLETYTPDLAPALRLAVSALESLDHINAQTSDSAFLAACIASNYDTLGSEDLAGSYGMRALKLLDTIPEPNEPEVLYQLAWYYNVSAYAVLPMAATDSNHAAYNGLLRAQAYARKALSIHPDHPKLPLLLFKIDGNLGALEANRGHYSEALQIHFQSREQRVSLFEQKGGKHLRKLIADSDRCIATDYFYLSRNASGESCKSLLQQSIAYHQKNLAFWAEFTGPKNFDYCVAANRLLSTELLYFKRFSSPDEISGRVPEICATLYHVTEFLASIPLSPRELERCLDNTVLLLKLSPNPPGKDVTALIHFSATVLPSLVFPAGDHWDRLITELQEISTSQNRL